VPSGESIQSNAEGNTLNTTTAAQNHVPVTASWPQGRLRFIPSLSGYHGTDVAPLRWFGMLAHDTQDINIDVNVPDLLGSLDQESPASRALGGHTPNLSADQESDSRAGSQMDNDALLWQASEPLDLLERERVLFARFVTAISPWLDLFDPIKHFSYFVPHLALRNRGLLNAILALAAQHVSLKTLCKETNSYHCTKALDYYQKTLQYLQSAMQYTSYRNSLELLATVIVVSTYEMIDGSDQAWERHLEGVFRIIRSREALPESRGLQRAIWWSWLRQDVWAAFRERRRCLTLLSLESNYDAMDHWSMADHAVYLLAQSVNYCSDEERKKAGLDVQDRVARGIELLDLLDGWKHNTDVHFNPLPAAAPSAYSIEPIWIHPTALGVAMQMQCVARILVLTHMPDDSHQQHEASNQMIQESIKTIIGVALSMTEDAGLVLSTQCLFAAGLYCSDGNVQSLIVDLVHSHNKQTGWPRDTDLVEELNAVWLSDRDK
jgi:hypothetical protein